jgi:hypothetical protein
MRIGTLKSKVVARQIEPADLSTPITQELTGANQATDDFVNPLRRVVLVKDACFGPIGYADPDAINQLVERFGIDTSGQPTRRGSAAEWPRKEFYYPSLHHNTLQRVAHFLESKLPSRACSLVTVLLCKGSKEPQLKPATIRCWNLECFSDSSNTSSIL